MKLPVKLSQSMHRQILLGQKHAPTILFGAGIIGVIGGTVLACRATLKLEPVLEDFKADLDDVKKDRPDDKKDLAYVYIRDTAKIVKLYSPAIVVGVISIGALTGSHVTLQKRNANLTATVVALTQAFNDYRERVRAEVGEERELELHQGVTRVKGKGGKPDTIVRDPNARSVYARLFDESNANWQPEAEYNRMFLTANQNYHNNMLRSRGHVLLNDVFDSLGMERSPAGAVVGWTLNKDRGDNYVDFGLEKSAQFINGEEASIWMDFNVDGVVFEEI